jgi:RHS repeat-associated protein
VPPDKALGEPQECAGNPIDVATGNKFEAVTDFATAGPHPIVFRRYYNSGASMVTPLGIGWRSDFGQRLWVQWSTSTTINQIRAFRPDGAVIRFSRCTSCPNGFSADTDVTASVRRVGNTIELTLEDDTVEIYTEQGGRLLEIRRRGYTQVFAYDTSNRLTTITDSHSRQIGFSYVGTSTQWASVTDPQNRLYKFVYDTASVHALRLAAVVYPDSTPATDADNPRVQYLYEDARFPYALTGIIDERGVRTSTFTYNADFRAVQTEHANGADLVQVVRNANGTVSVTNALGRTTVNTFSTLQGMQKLTSAAGQPTANCPAASRAVTYDSRGFVASRTDWRGNTTNYTNDTRGLPNSMTEAAGTPQARTTTTTWHGTFRLPTQIVAPGLTTSLTYDVAGRVLTKTETDTTSHSVPYSTNGQTRSWTYTYSSTGQMLSEDGPRTDVSDVTTYEYTPQGYLKKITNPLGHIVEITAHTGMGLPATIVDANGVTRQFTYDTRDRLISSTVVHASGNAVTQFEYDPIGQITATVLPDGSRLEHVYNAARRLTETRNTLGEKIEYAYDAMGNVTSETIRAAGGSITYSMTKAYDELGRLLRIIRAGGRTTTFGYDKNGNVVSELDARNHSTSFAYDALDRLVSTTNAINGVTTTTYNALDQVTAVSDQRALTTGYVSNGFGFAIQTSSPDTGITVRQVDPAGNVTQSTDARGVVVNMTYDALGRMLTRTYPSSPAENVSFTYDSTSAGNRGIGRQTGMTDETGSTAWKYDHRGNLIEEARIISGVTYVTVYGHDLADRLASITYPSGRIVSYTRDALGRVTSVSIRANPAASPLTVVSNVTYLPFGPIAGFTHGNGLVRAHNFDADYRFMGFQVTGASPVIDRAYTRDAVDNVTAINNALTPTLSESFAYDPLNRLSQAIGGYGTFNWAFDAVGNRTTQQHATSSSTVTETSTYAANSNRLLSVANGTTTRAFTYDAAGHMATDDRGGAGGLTFIHNHAGRLSSITQGATALGAYLHSGISERAAKSTAAGVRHFIYDSAGNLIAEASNSGAVIREHITLEGLPLALVDASISPAALHAVHVDHLATPIAMTDPAGGVSWQGLRQPYGATAIGAVTATNDNRFPGQRLESETGLHYNYFRDYDPSTGRYVQSDPIGLAGGLNTYGYVLANPVNLIDPEGLQVVLPLPPPPIPAPPSNSGRPGNNSGGNVIPFPPGGKNKPSDPSKPPNDQKCPEDRVCVTTGLAGFSAVGLYGGYLTCQYMCPRKGLRSFDVKLAYTPAEPRYLCRPTVPESMFP